MRKNNARVGLVILTMLLAAAPLGLTRADPEPAAVTPTAITENPDWLAPQQLSVSDKAEKLPVIAAHPDNGRVVTLYSIRNSSSGADEVAYRISNDFGNSWSAAQLIYTSPLTDSVQANVALTPAGGGRAVWVENISLAYAPESEWGSGAVTFISEPSLPPGASNPELKVANNYSLHVVWTESAGATPDVYYARSGNGGATWTKSLVRATGPSTFAPSLAFDPSNPSVVHVVWEEKEGLFGSIFYSRGIWNNGSMSWSPAIEISELGESELDDSKDFRPKIIWKNGQRQVVYTHVSEADPDFQMIYYTSCHSNCTSRSGWTVQELISGQAVGANATDPFNVYSAMATLGDCTFVYFHGTDSDFSQDNEGIWGVNSCDGWSAAARDEVTDPTQTRSIYPVIASHPDGWIYLVYEQVVNQQRQVYFTRGEVEINHGVFLPVVMNN